MRQRSVLLRLVVALAAVLGAIIGFRAFHANQVEKLRAIRAAQIEKICALSDAAKRGRLWAPTCKGCHDITGGQPDLDHSSGGPNLQNVYMSLAGTRPAAWNPTAAIQYPYPPLAAARAAGIVWTDDNLFQYLQNPQSFLVKKTGKYFPSFYMPFSIADERARGDVIAYLKAIKGRPECD